MKLLTIAKTTLVVIFLTLSLMACKSSQNKPASDAPVICQSSAFVGPKDYEVAPLASKSDNVYHRWVADNYITKLPTLKIAYTDLLECWNYYHPQEK